MRWAVLVVLVIACGGEVEPPACDLGDRSVACDDSVTVLRSTDAGTVGDMCSRVGCTPGDRCVAFLDGKARQGVCR